MGAFFKRLWREPVLAGAVAVAALNAVLLLPDWRQALASVATSIAAGAAVRARVTPT